MNIKTKLFLITFLTALLCFHQDIVFSQKCIDLGCGIKLLNSEYAFIDFCKNGERWGIVRDGDSENVNFGYQTNTLNEFKVVNGAYWTWDADWDGSPNDDLWQNWDMDSYISYYHMSIDQGAFDAQGWPKDVPYTIYKYHTKTEDPDQGIDVTQPVQINEVTRKYYFPDGLPQDSWILKWEGTGTFSWEGLEIINEDIGTVSVGGNSWTPYGSYAGKNITFSSTGQGRIECRHFYMVHGWVLTITDSDPNDPIRNISFIYPGLESNFDAGEIFQPNYVERLKQFSMLRYSGFQSMSDIEKRKVMDVGHPYQDSHMLKYMEWDEKTPDDWYRADDGSGGGLGYIVELANLTKADAWIGIPYCASLDYADSLVNYLLERIDPDLTIYLEIGNELWNSAPGFYGFHWQARNRVLRYPGLGDAQARGAYINDIFERVTNVAGSRGLERIERVYAGFPRYTDVNNKTIDYIDQDNWDCFATTWYFGLEQNDPANMECIDEVSGENWRKVLYDWHLANTGDQAGFNQKYKECLLNEFRCLGGYSNNSDVLLANYYGKYVVCYEGGNHTTYGCTNAPYSRIALEDYDGSADELDFDSPTWPDYLTDNSFIAAVCIADESQEIADVYNEVIDSMQSAGIKVANHLSFAKQSSCYGVWSFIQPKDMDEDLATLLTAYPKFKVFSDRIAEDNCDAIYIDLDTNLVGAGLSVTMDGFNDYIEGSSSGIPDETSDYSFEAWFTIRNLDMDQMIISLTNDGSNDNYNKIFVRDDGKIVWQIGNNSTVYVKLVGSTLTGNKWDHVAVTKSGVRYTLYLNGQNVASGNFTLSALARNHFTLGATYNGTYGESNFGGEIDEVRCWNTALSQNEIRNYMCKKVTGAHPNWADLINYYRFDRPDKENFEVYDIKAGTNTGQLYNINFTSRSRYAISGAPIGDYSKFVYTGGNWSGVGLTLSHTEGDMIALSNVQSTAAYGAHVYIVDDEAYYNDMPQHYDGISDDRYFGAFIAGGNEVPYDLSYIYQGNPQALSGEDENKHRLLRRENSADEFWVHSGAKLDLIANVLTVSCKEKDRGEYTLAFRSTDNELRPGAGMALYQNIDQTDEVDGGRLIYLDLYDYTVTFWAKGYGTVFNFTKKFQAGFEKFTCVGSSGGNENISAGFDFSTAYAGQSFDFGSSPIVGKSDEWIHWAVVRDGTNITVYANGRKVVTKDFVGNNHIEELYILDAPGWVETSDITIDEFTVWNVPLPQNVIRDWMCKKITEEHPYECENLVLYFNFDEGQGTVLEDKRGRSDIILNPANSWAISGAAIGDESVYDYSTPENLSFTHPDGDYIDVTKTSLEPVYGVHLYKVNEPPVPSTVSGGTILSMDSSRYWGLFVVDDYDKTVNYDMVMTYTGNSMIIPGKENELRLMSRTNAENALWMPNDGILPNTGAGTIILNNQHFGEYILGGTTTTTFIDDCTPAQPVFVAEAGLVNMSVICANTTNLMYVVQNDPSVESYIWNLPDGLSGFSASDTITVIAELGYQSPPDFTISVTGVNRCGESSSATIDITINPSSTLADAGPDQLILPPATSATMDGNAYTGGETGTWTFGSVGSGAISLPNDPLTTVTGLATGSNILIWTIDNGVCQPSVDSTEIMIAPPPYDITLANGDPLPQRICEGELLTLKAIPAEDVTPDGYQWTLPNGLSEVSSTGDKITVLVGSGYGGSIEVSSVYSGSTSEPYVSEPVGINPQPNKPVFADDYSVICYLIDMDIQAEYDATIDSFVWTLPTYLVPSSYPISTTETIEIQALDTITGYIKVQAYNNGCTNSDAIDSMYFEVYIAPDRPQLHLGTDGDTGDEVCSGEEGMFWIRDPDTAVMYEWRWNTNIEIVEYYGINHSGARFQLPGSNSGIWVRAVSGTGACSASEEWYVNTWARPFTPETVTNITISDPPATDPMDLQVGQTYTVDVTGTATNFYWNIPEGVEILDNPNNRYDVQNQIIVNEDFAGYLEIYPVTYRGCSGGSMRIAIGTAGSLMPPEFVSGTLKICQGTALNIDITDVAGATEYVWTLPDGTEVVTATSEFNQVIGNSQYGTMYVYARAGATESYVLDMYVEVDAGVISLGNFIDGNGNPLITLPICSDYSREPIYYENVGASQIIWEIDGGAIQFDPAYQPGHEGDVNYLLENRTTLADTMIPITYESWREANYGSEGYIKIDLINNCGGSSLKDSIYYNVVTPITSLVPVFTNMPTSVCVGSSVIYRLEPIDNAEQYIWGLPSGLEASSIVTTVPELRVDVVNGIGGELTVYAIGSVCGGGQTPVQHSNPITISGSPSNFDFVEAPLAGCPGDNLTFSVNDAGVSAYTWNTPLGLSPDVPGKSIAIDNNDPECIQFGTWDLISDASYLNGSYLSQNGNNSYDKYVLYTPNIPVSGRYRVTLSHAPYEPQLNDYRMYVDVIDKNGPHQNRIYYSNLDSPLPSPIFEDLGVYDFDIGTSGYVRINTEGSEWNRPVKPDHVKFELIEEFIVADTSITFEVTSGGAGSLCVTIENPQCESGYTVCSEPINLGGTMDTPVFEGQSSDVCIGLSYQYQVNNIGADTYTWILPSGMSIGGSTGEVSGLTRTETIEIDSDPGTAVEIQVFGVINSCSVISDTATSLSITVSNCDLTDPVFIVEEDTVCSGIDILFSILPVFDAEFYEWILPTGIEQSGTGATGTVTTTVPNITLVATGSGELDTISVRATAPVAGISSSNWIGTTNPIVVISQPAFTVSTNDETNCTSSNGEIIITGLSPATTYQISYNDGTVQGPGAYTSDGSEQVTITSLAENDYTDITVSLGSCSTVDNTVYTISPPSAASISSVDFTSPATCGEPGSISITLSNATEGDLYEIDLNDDASPEDTIAVSSGVLEMTGINTNLTITGLAVTNILTSCSDNTADAGSITMLDTAQIIDVVFTQPLVCGGTGTIEIQLSGATDGDIYDIDYQNDGTDDNTGTVSGGNILLSGLTAGIAITNLVITHQTTLCPSESDSTGSLQDPGSAVIDTVNFTNPATCGGTGTIQVTLSGVTDGEVYDIDYENDNVVDNTGIVATSAISISSLPAGTAVTNLVLSNQSTGCKSTTLQTDTLTEPDLPPVELTPYAPMCEDAAQITLTGGSPPLGTYTVNGAIAIDFDPAAQGAGTYELVYSYTDANNCENRDTADIIVNPLPSGTLTSNDAANEFCLGEEAQFTATDGDQYTFYVNSTAYNNGANDMISFSDLVNEDTIGVEVSLNGCMAQYAPIIVTVYDLPGPTIIAVGGITSVCKGEPVTFEATGGTNFNFLVNDVSTQNSGNNTFAPTNLADGDIVTAIVEDLNGCSAYADNTIAVMVTELPDATISGNTEVCLFAEYEVYWVPYNKNNTYIWNVTGGIITNSDTDQDQISINWTDENQGTIEISIVDTVSTCSSQNSINVTLADNNMPVIDCMEGITMDGVLGETGFYYEFGDKDSYLIPSVYDSCGIAQVLFSINGIEYDSSEFKGFRIEQAYNEITWIVEDLKRQRSTCQIVVQMESEMLIPSAFSPNGDGINDYWEMPFLQLYENCIVKVFDRHGKTVYESKPGYSNPWQGDSDGRILPIDSYHYIIDKGDGDKPKTGSVTIIK